MKTVSDQTENSFEIMEKVHTENLRMVYSVLELTNL
jgi:hypothetical protein